MLWLTDIGAFFRWLLKGCKTKLRDELQGIGEPTWGPSIDFENYVIGLLVDIVIIALFVIVGCATSIF